MAGVQIHVCFSVEVYSHLFVFALTNPHHIMCVQYNGVERYYRGRFIDTKIPSVLWVEILSTLKDAWCILENIGSYYMEDY